MELRKCKCGAEPTEYEFVIQCNNCGLTTRWFANHKAAVNAWNLGVDLVRRYPITGKCIKPGDEIYAK